MKKTIIASLVMVAMAATLLTGCGTAKDNSSGKVTITIPDKQINNVGVAGYTKELQEEFDKLYGDEIEVKHVMPYSTSDLNDTRGQAALLLGSDAPAYIGVSNAYVAKSLYEMGVVADISKYVKDNEEFKSLRSAAVDAYTFSDGSIVGYPSVIEVPLLGFYNDALMNAGYDVATFSCKTWDEYYKVAKKMTTAETKGSSLFLGEFLLWPQNWLLSNDAHVAIQNKDGTMTLNFTDKKVVETVEFMRKLYKDGLTNDNIGASDTNAMFSAIYGGNVSSFTMYPQWIDRFVSQGIYPEDITLSTFPVGPNGEKQQALHVAGFVFNSQLTEKELEAAIKYVTFMNGTEAENGKLEYSKNNSISDVMISSNENVDWTVNLVDFPEQWIETIKEALEVGVAESADANGYFTYICAKLPAIVKGDGDISKALQEAQDLATNEWLKDFNSDKTKAK